ncbi:hypothetical protein DYB32_001558 [Aphanomyces invadans]|uniref:Uncharacterized protein n=1 Tax=Aphanomyces invadans TaxID=157072 RepID=A0A3R6VGD7_9STRA|nr:hypothetical protein DYB32_001558 [Aphanomyces invadans]
MLILEFSLLTVFNRSIEPTFLLVILDFVYVEPVTFNALCPSKPYNQDRLTRASVAAAMVGKAKVTFHLPFIYGAKAKSTIAKEEQANRLDSFWFCEAQRPQTDIDGDVRVESAKSGKDNTYIIENRRLQSLLRRKKQHGHVKHVRALKMESIYIDMSDQKARMSPRAITDGWLSEMEDKMAKQRRRITNAKLDAVFGLGYTFKLDLATLNTHRERLARATFRKNQVRRHVSALQCETLTSILGVVCSL